MEVKEKYLGKDIGGHLWLFDHSPSVMSYAAERVCLYVGVYICVCV